MKLTLERAAQILGIDSDVPREHQCGRGSPESPAECFMTVHVPFYLTGQGSWPAWGRSARVLGPQAPECGGLVLGDRRGSGVSV